MDDYKERIQFYHDNQITPGTKEWFSFRRKNLTIGASEIGIIEESERETLNMLIGTKLGIRNRPMVSTAVLLGNIIEEFARKRLSDLLQCPIDWLGTKTKDDFLSASPDGVAPLSYIDDKYLLIELKTSYGRYVRNNSRGFSPRYEFQVLQGMEIYDDLVEHSLLFEHEIFICDLQEATTEKNTRIASHLYPGHHNKLRQHMGTCILYISPKDTTKTMEEILGIHDQILSADFSWLSKRHIWDLLSVIQETDQIITKYSDIYWQNYDADKTVLLGDITRSASCRQVSPPLIKNDPFASALTTFDIFHEQQRGSTTDWRYFIVFKLGASRCEWIPKRSWDCIRLHTIARRLVKIILFLKDLPSDEKQQTYIDLSDQWIQFVYFLDKDEEITKKIFDEYHQLRKIHAI